MNIAVATNDLQKVTGHIGRCKAFMVYNIHDGTVDSKEVRENLFTNHRLGNRHHERHSEGEGHHHTRLIDGLKDCSYLISKGGGWRVVEDLKKHGIVTLFTSEPLVEESVAKFLKGELKNEVDLECRHHDEHV